MSDELEWNEKGDDEYEARSGQRHYVIWKQPGPEWMVQGYARPNPNRDIEVKIGDPILSPTLEEAKQQAQWWESEQKLWPKAVGADETAPSEGNEARQDLYAIAVQLKEIAKELSQLNAQMSKTNSFLNMIQGNVAAKP